MASCALLFPLETLSNFNKNKLRVEYLNSLNQELDYSIHQSNLTYLTSSFNADVLIINEILNQEIDLIKKKLRLIKDYISY